MVSAFETAVGLAQATLRTAGPTATVSITRDATTVTGKTAVIGSTKTENITQEGVTILSKVRDFLIAVAAYDLGGGPVVPAEGDVIMEGTVQYTVMPLGDEAYRYSDPFRKVWRIHTKQTN